MNNDPTKFVKTPIASIIVAMQSKYILNRPSILIVFKLSLGFLNSNCIYKILLLLVNIIVLLHNKN